MYTFKNNKYKQKIIHRFLIFGFIASGILITITQFNVLNTSVSANNKQDSNLPTLQPWIHPNDFPMYIARHDFNNDNNRELNFVYTGNPKLKPVFLQAVKKWNKLKVIHLKEVQYNPNNNFNDNSKTNYHIVLHGAMPNFTGNDDFAFNTKVDNAQTLTYFATNIPSHNDKFLYLPISKSIAELPDNITNKPRNFQVKIATHEIGHTLGFDDDEHDMDFGNIMWPYGDDIFLNPGYQEKQTLKYYY